MKKGQKMSEEIKHKISLARKGKFSIGTGFKKGHKINTGRSKSIITRKKIQQNAYRQFKNGMPAETKDKLSKIMKKKHSIESWGFQKGHIDFAKNKGRKHSLEFRDKCRERMKKRLGRNSPNWKGGITTLKRRVIITLGGRIRACQSYKEWRYKIFKRDNYTCQACNCKKYLNAHHIESFNKIIKKYNIKTIEQSIKCKKLWDVDNGISLCYECHKKIHNKYGFNISKSNMYEFLNLLYGFSSKKIQILSS